MIRLVAAALAALALAGTAAAGVLDAPARYLVGQQAPSGGFAEPGRAPDAALTAWAALGLVAAGAAADISAPTLGYLVEQEQTLRDDGARALNALARVSLGDRPERLLAALAEHRPDAAVNATIWVVLALAAAGEEVPRAYTRALLAAQHRSGGWSWARGGAPDSNDTSAAVQALRVAGVTGRPIERALVFLRRCRNVDGGYGLVPGRPSDAQSTAWAIQALIAAGRAPGTGPFRFLSRLRRPDGSYRYSVAYATTPVWVTAQVLPALAGKPFPFASARRR